MRRYIYSARWLPELCAQKVTSILAVYPGKESLRRKKIDILQRLTKEGCCNVDPGFFE